MSFFGKLFGKGGDKDPVTTGEAIQKLRETEDMLMKKQARKFISWQGEFNFPVSGFPGEENRNRSDHS